MIRLTFPQVLAVLHSTRRIDPDKTSAFLARVKHLKRLGFPPGSNTGSGKPVGYTVEQLFQLVIAFELIGSGMPPQRAIQIILSDWKRIRGWIRMAVNPPSPGRTLYFVTNVDALREMSTEGVSDAVRGWEMIHRVFDHALLEHFAHYPGGKSVSNATKLVGEVCELLSRQNIASTAEIHAELENWQATDGHDQKA